MTDTAAIDPFDPNAGADADDDETFGTPTRGAYPKVGELLHKLLILIPVKVEQVPDQNNAGKLQERWSIDTIVVDPDGTAVEYDSMYWSHKSIAAAAAKAMKDKRPMLGTLHLFPVMATKKRYATETELLTDQDIVRWIERGSGLPPTPVAWALEPATVAEKAVALKWWRENKNPFGK